MGLILFELNFVAAKLVIDKIRYSWNSLPLVIPDLIRDPESTFSLSTRFETFLLDSGSMLRIARNDKGEESKEA